ncbi:hypothetical protein PanWU01x14_280810, partial [Parasponia andersonii]
MDRLFDVIGAEKSRFDLQLKVLHKMDNVVLPPTILTNDTDVEFWLDDQMQSCVPETAKEENEDHHTKLQLYDLSACPPVEPTNSQVPIICAVANNYSEIHEQLNDRGKDVICLGEAMAFYGERMNLNSDDNHSMSDDGCNNDNYDTMSELMRRERM